MSTMRERARRARPGFRLLLPRPTIRLRLTLLYASLFLGSGACLLAFTYLAVAHLIGSYGFSFSAYSQGTQIGVHLPQILQTLESRQAGAEKRQLLVVSGIALAMSLPAAGEALAELAQRAGALRAASGGRLLECFAAVPDARSARGIRHPLPAVLALAVAGVLSGCEFMEDVTAWTAAAGQDVLAACGAPG